MTPAGGSARGPLRPYLAREAQRPAHPLGAQAVRFLMVPEDGGSPHLTVGRSHWPPRASGKLHLHDGWDEMFYVLAGTGSLTVDGRVYALAPGTFVLAPKGIEHAVTDSGPDGLELLFLLSPGVPASAIIPSPAGK